MAGRRPVGVPDGGAGRVLWRRRQRRARGRGAFIAERRHGFDMPTTVRAGADHVTGISPTYDGAMADSLAALRALVRDHGTRAVVSDLDGVLRRFDPSLWAQLDAATGTPQGTAFTAILGHPFLDEVVRGRGTHRQWRERAVSELIAAGSAPRAARDAIATWWGSSATVDQEVLAELERLRASGLGVFVLTNGTDQVPEELEELGLSGFLGTHRRFLLNTADLGAAKPDREAFVRAHARIEAELGEELLAEQVAFLDDSPRHVRGATSFGWRALLHTAG